MEYRSLFVRSSLTFLFLFQGLGVSSQIPKSKDYSSAIQNYDLSSLWLESLPNVIGFIGSDYQRFYIHFSSISRDSKNKLRYNVAGKTKVKNNICSFKGVIAIQKAEMYNDSDHSIFGGFVFGDCVFFEDATQPYSGKIKGRLGTDFYLDSLDHIHYDDLNGVADGYSNNEFTGYWQSYKHNKKKRCNWGEGRIPGTRGTLDQGDGEFMVSKKYQNNGWQNFVAAWQTYGDTAKQNEARAIEKDEWWKK